MSIVLGDSGDAVANASIDRASVTSSGYTFNGTTWDRARGNVDSVINVTDVTTATYTGPDIINYNGRSLIVVFNTTSLTGTSWQPGVQIKDGATGLYFNALALPAADTTIGAHIWIVGPYVVSTLGATAAGGSTAVLAQTNVDLELPRIFRVVIVKVAVTVFSCTIGATISL